MKKLLTLVASLLVTLPNTSYAAIAFGAIGSSFDMTGSYTSVAVSGTNTIGFVCAIGDIASDNISAISWGGSSMTKIAAVQSTGNRWMSLWYIINPTSASTITLTGGTTKESDDWYYTGAKQTGQPDSFNTNTALSTTAISVSTTVVASNSWFTMCQKDSTGGTTYTGSGVIGSMRLATDPSGTGAAIGDSNGTVGTGSQTGTMTTGGSTDHEAIAVSIAPAATTGAVKVPDPIFWGWW